MIIDTARSRVLYATRASVCPVDRQQQPRAVGLLLSAPQTGDISQQQTLALNSNGAAARRSAVNAGSVVGSQGTRLNTNLFCKNTLHDFRGPHQWRQREFKVGGRAL